MVTILAVKIKEKENLSMMRIITPKGELRKVKRVVAVCEMRNQFNGRMDRKIEIANDLSYKPTGLCLKFDTEGTNFRMYGQELYIGNLKTEKVQEILRKLVKEGYFDFSEMEYQKMDMVENTVFDEGKSKPYTSDFLVDYCSMLLCLGNTIPNPMRPAVSGRNVGIPKNAFDDKNGYNEDDDLTDGYDEDVDFGEGFDDEE